VKFLCLGYYDQAAFDQAPKAETRSLMEDCNTRCDRLRETGKVLIERGLDHPLKAKCVRSRKGTRTVTDGPFAETKEQLGSFFIIEAENMEEAIELASLHPGAFMGEEFGFGIEIRQFED